MSEFKRVILKELLEKEYKEGARVRLIKMKGEKQMQKGLCGTVRCVDDICQIHVNWDNGSSLALQPEIGEFELIEEKQKERKTESKIEIPAFGGSLIVERNPEPAYDGVSVYFKDSSGSLTDIAVIEVKDELERKQIDVYSYEDIHSDDYSRKTSIKIEEILEESSK